MKKAGITVIFFLLIALNISCKSDRVDASVYKSREKLIMMGYDFTEDGFIKAINEGKLDVVKLFIDSGMSPDTTSKIGETSVPAIFFALEKQQDLLAQLLVNSGADLSANTKGVTILMKAVEKGNAETISLILKKGADVNEPGDDGLTPLMIAIERKNSAAFWLLLKSGADVNKADMFGITPLMRAVRIGEIDIVRELLKKGADVKAESKNGMKLESTVNEKKREDIKILLKQAGLKI